MKTYEMAFAIQAKINNTVHRAIGGTAAEIENLKGRIFKLNQLQNQVSGFNKLTEQSQKFQAQLVNANARAKELMQTIKNSEVPNRDLSTEYGKQLHKVSELQSKLHSLRSTMMQENQELKAAGVNIRRVDEATLKLATDCVKLNNKLHFKTNLQDIAKRSEEQLRHVFLLTSELRASIMELDVFAKPIEKAMEFESVIASINKLAHFNVAEKAQFQQGLMDMAGRVPQDVAKLGEIAEIGASNGIEKQDLVEFAEDAAHIGVAYNISAQQASTAMAGWRHTLEMSRSKVLDFADAIHYMQDTMGASGGEVGEIVNRTGAMAKLAGVSYKTTAAMGAVAKAYGGVKEASSAATAINEMLTALMSGQQATKKQAEGFDELGISVMQLSRDMQTNGDAALFDVLERIRKLDPTRQASMIKQLFGQNSIGIIGGFITKLDKLKATVKDINDPKKYSGLVMKENATRNATTQNSLQLLKNNMNNVAIALGNVFLPVITSVANKISSYAKDLIPFIENHKGLVKIVGEVIVGFTALKVAMVALKIVAMGGLWGNLQLLKGALTAYNAITKIAAATQWLWNAALAANPIVLVIGGLALLTAGLVFFFGYTKIGQKAWHAMCTFMKDTFNSLYEWFAKKWQWIVGQYEKVKGFFSGSNEFQAHTTLKESTAALQKAQATRSINNTVHYSPNINVTVNGHADKKIIDKAVNDHQKGFNDWYSQMQRDAVRFAN